MSGTIATAAIAVPWPNRYRHQQRSPTVFSMLIAFGFILGAVLGSFLNVCIVRLPLGESIVLPASHCRHCGGPVRVKDNIPLLSFLLLRGRCRDCGEAISRRYPIVELVTACLFAVSFATAPLSLVMGLRLLFLCALLVVTVIDLDHQIIPDRITLPGIVVGLMASACGLGIPIVDSAIGMLLGGGMLYLIAVGYHALTGVEGMGGGDIKLLAMIGAFLGWQAVLLTLLLASSSGALYGAVLVASRSANSRVPIPFGPFLAMGATCALFFGDALVDWYLQHVLLA